MYLFTIANASPVDCNRSGCDWEGDIDMSYTVTDRSLNPTRSNAASPSMHSLLYQLFLWFAHCIQSGGYEIHRDRIVITGISTIII